MTLGWQSPALAGQWPFDQRQILLARPEGQTFPDDLTTAQIMDVFVKKGRVRWVTRPGAAGQLVPVEIPKDFQWRSTEAVKKLGGRYKVDGVLILSTKGSEVQLNWYSTSDGQPLFFETLYLPSAGQSADQAAKRKQRLTDWLLDIWSRIPGQGYVVNRDVDTVEVEGADNEGFKVGDQVEIVRLEKIERHPVLKTLTGIQSSVVGMGEVTSIASPFSKIKITYESDLDPIHEGDRYRLIVSNAVGSSLGSLPGAAAATAKEDTPRDDSALPRLGEVLGIDSRFLDLFVNLGYGRMTHNEVSATSDKYNMNAQGLFLKMRADLLVAREWFAGVDYSVGFHKFSTLPTDYAESSLKSGLQNLKVFGAYRWIIEDGDVQQKTAATELHILGGYDRMLAKMEASTSAVAPSQKTYSGLFLGVAMQIPVLEFFSITAEFDKAFGTSLNEQVETSGATSKNSLWNYDFLFNYTLGKAKLINFGLHNYKGSSVFTGAGTRATASASAYASGLYGSLGYQQTF